MGVGLFALASIVALSLFHHGDWEHSSHMNSYNLQAVRRDAVGNQGTAEYYFSAESMDYEAALKQCQFMYGSKYGLATIDNKDDQRRLNAYLKQYMGSGGELWVNGLWLNGEKSWVWDTWLDENGDSVKFSSFALGLFPGGVPKPQTPSQAYYVYVDKYSGELHNASKTETRRFVCQNRLENGPPPCREKTDIAVVLDSSASIGDNDYEWAKNGSAAIVKSFAGHTPSRQYGNIYADQVQTVLPLNFQGTAEQKAQKFLNAPYLRGNTNTGGAIQDATSVLYQNKRSDAPQAIVVITDGKSNRGPNVADVSRDARSKGIQMVAVGIGSQIDKKELNSIASSPELVFTTESWSELDNILAAITSAMCPNSRLSRRG